MSEKSTIEKLKAKKAQIEAQIQMAKAREKVTERKKDVRRKILAGAYYLDRINKEKAFDELTKAMDGYLVRDNDRILFGLSPKTPKTKKATAEKKKSVS